LQGRAAETLLPRLLPLLDGTRTVEELIIELGSSVAPAIEQALSLLDEHQLLREGTHSRENGHGRTAAATYAAAVTRRTTEESATRALLDAHVAVLGSGRCAKTTASQLEEIGIGRVDLLAPADEPAAGALVVAVPSARELPELERVNERALELGTAWLQVLPFDGRLTIVGPLYLPNASACRCCFVLRRGACSGYEDDFELVESQPSRALSPTPLTTMAAGLAANVVLRWMTAKDPTLPGRFYALESRTILRLSYEHVLRVPRCPACGPAASAVPSPWFEESP